MKVKREKLTPDDVGPSPLDWDTPLLSEVSTLITNGFVGTATPFYSDESGVPYLYGTNVRPNKLDLANVRFITHEFHQEQSKTALKTGDLLMVQSGHIGETAIVTPEVDGANCHALIVTRLKKERALPEFICQYINSEIGQARLNGLKVGSSIAHINTKDLKKFVVLLPSIKEQATIAQILSTWDKAIATTERLLANSQQQKQALMQQLLTGLKRLRGFSHKWSKASVASCVLGSSRRNSDSKLSVENVMSVNKTEGMIPMREQTIGKSIDRYKIVKFGWFAYNPMRINVGSICRWDRKADCLVSPDYVVFECNEDVLLGSYFDQFRKSESWTSYMNNAGNGSVRVRIYLNDLSQLEIPLPPLAEQQKIAQVLATADAEIANLQAQLAKLKLEKKALMQQLLTGQRRVRLDDEAAA